MSKKKIYCGNGRQINTKYGETLRLSLHSDDVERLQAHINKAGWVNVNVSKRQKIGKRGETHYLTIDTWKPSLESINKETAQPEASFDDDNIPF